MIVTKYLGPTDHRGSRVVARSHSRRITVAWDDALDPNENHDAAARKLARLIGWDGLTLVRGETLDSKGNVYMPTTWARVEVRDGSE